MFSLCESIYVGVSLNGGTPKTPEMIIFSRKTPWLLGTTILGNTHVDHFRSI